MTVVARVGVILIAYRVVVDYYTDVRGSRVEFSCRFGDGAAVRSVRRNTTPKHDFMVSKRPVNVYWQSVSAAVSVVYIGCVRFCSDYFLFQIHKPRTLNDIIFIQLFTDALKYTVLT